MSEDILRLEQPTEAHEAAAWAYRQAFIEAGETAIPGGVGLGRAADYGGWLTHTRQMRSAPPEGAAPREVHLAMVGTHIVGILSVSHRLTDALLEHGGHIGYSVHPAHRRRGYATRMLALALTRCEELGIGRVLVMCDRDNEASRRTILRNGGVMENEITQADGGIVQRYWITLKGD